MNQRINQRAVLDRFAVGLSGLCMLHCLALPVVLTLTPIVGGSLISESLFHQGLLWFIVPVSVIALGIGCRQHKDRPTIMLGAAGLSILVFTAFLGHELFGITGERVVTSLGGLVLASAHIRNYRICRHVDCDHSEIAS
jgi:hypothetical protein